MPELKKKNLLLFLPLLFVFVSLSTADDPALNDRIGYCEIISELTESDPVRATDSGDSRQPSFTITHTVAGSDVTIHVTSDENLYTGWSAEKEIWSVTNFDYWWLNTRMSKDDENNIYAAVKLYEYSNPSNNFDLFVLENNGDIGEQFLDWNGPGNNPLIVNNPDPNIYLERPTLDREGVVDSENNTYVFYNNGGSNIIFTKLDAEGSLLINNLTIITGANAWTNSIRTDVAPDGRIYIVWSDDMHEIMYSYSDDGGDTDTWSTPASICYNATHQLNKPQICCGSNGNVHVIWQHWTGSSNLLSYMKLLPDGTVSIDESFLTPASNQVWAAIMDIDEENNLHIVWAKSSQQVTSAYYTKINGNLDGGGQPVSDEDLSIVQEEAFLVSQEIRYPKCAVDNYHNVHAIYERGEYGCNHPKAVYYMKNNSIPLLRIVCPDDSLIFVEMTGSGTEWEGTFTAPMTGTYNVRASGSNESGDTGVGFYEFEFSGGGIESSDEMYLGSFSNYPNPFNQQTTITYAIAEPVHVSLQIFDIGGRLIDTLFEGNQQAGYHSVLWNVKDVSTGVYLYRITAGSITETRRCLVTR